MKRNYPYLRCQRGFSLIEILTVIVIIAILAAIAVPVFLNQRQKAWDASVKSDLYNAAIAQADYNGELGSYTDQVANLTTRGLTQTNRVFLSIPESGANYCMEAFHNGNPDRIWFARNGQGQPNPELGTCDGPDPLA